MTETYECEICETPIDHEGFCARCTEIFGPSRNPRPTECATCWNKNDCPAYGGEGRYACADPLTGEISVTLPDDCKCPCGNESDGPGELCRDCDEHIDARPESRW